MKKSHIICSILLIGFSGYVLAKKMSIYENSMPREQNMTLKNTKSFPGFSVMLYLPLMDDRYSSVMAQSQMTVTPTTTYTVRAIKVTGWYSSDGSCTDLYGSTNIDNGAGNTVILMQNHHYVTTDASNWALNQLAITPIYVFDPAYDTTYQLLDNSLANVGASVCVAAGGACTNATNCGWSIPKTWTP